MQYFSSNPSNIACVSVLILSVYYTFFYSIFNSVISKPQIFLKKTAFHIIQAPFQKHNPRIAYDGTSSNSAYKHTALYRAFSLSWHWSSQRPRHRCCTPNDNTARSKTCSVPRLKKKLCNWHFSLLHSTREHDNLWVTRQYRKHGITTVY